MGGKGSGRRHGSKSKKVGAPKLWKGNKVANTKFKSGGVAKRISGIRPKSKKSAKTLFGKKQAIKKWGK